MYFNYHPMRILRAFLPLIAALGIANIAAAQSVTNVDANQEGKAIAITYDLNEKANVSVYVTDNAGYSKIRIPQTYLSGDTGKNVRPGKEKKALWHVLDQYPDQDFQADFLSFIVVAKPVMQFYATVNGGYSPDSGAMLGATIGQVGTIGWYVKGMATLSSTPAAVFECDEHGAIDGILPAYSGASKKSKFFGVAGINLRLGAPVYLYAGVGYGARNLTWELADGRWVKHLTGSYKGVAIDAGLMGKIGHIALSAGATLVSGKVDFNAGVGYVF